MDLNLLYPKYTELRSANKEFARKMVISLYHHERSIWMVAALLRTTRKTLRKTPPHLELPIISLRKRRGYGRKEFEICPKKGKYKRSKYRRRQRFHDFEPLFPMRRALQMASSSCLRASYVKPINAKLIHIPFQEKSHEMAVGIKQGRTIPYEKLIQYYRFSKKVALFSVMILDKTVNILDVFFPKRGG